MIVAISAGRQASPELRMRLALDRAAVRGVLRLPRPGIVELAVLSTCHRTELYGVADGDDADAVHAAVSLLPALAPTDHAELAVMRGADAVRHLYRVAAGLDSLVVGEPQILGQVRDALSIARLEGSVGPRLGAVFGDAVAVGRRVRARTMLGRISSTLGALAADHIDERLGGLTGRMGAVVGSGVAARDAARALHRRGARLVVVGRSSEPARLLAESLDAEARGMDMMAVTLEASEFAVVAVGGGALHGVSRLPERSRSAPLELVDLSVPPAVQLDGREDVRVRTIEDLTPREDAGLTRAAERASHMVDEAVEAWVRAARDATTAGVGRFRTHVESRVRAELERSLPRMNLSDADAERVASLAMRIANKLMHGPTVALRNADEQTRAVLARVFGLDEAGPV